MPSLPEVATMSRKNVFRTLCRLHSSSFYGLKLNGIHKEIKFHSALSYLVTMIIVNDMAKSNLKKIKECEPQLECDILKEKHQDEIDIASYSNQPICPPR